MDTETGARYCALCDDFRPLSDAGLYYVAGGRVVRLCKDCFEAVAIGTRFIRQRPAAEHSERMQTPADYRPADMAELAIMAARGYRELSGRPRCAPGVIEHQAPAVIEHQAPGSGRHNTRRLVCDECNAHVSEHGLHAVSSDGFLPSLQLCALCYDRWKEQNAITQPHQAPAIEHQAARPHQAPAVIVGAGPFPFVIFCDPARAGRIDPAGPWCPDDPFEDGYPAEYDGPMWAG